MPEFREWFNEYVASSAEIDPEAISRRVLTSLYLECCDYHDLRPMPLGRFERSLKGAGFMRYRSSAPGRPWRYRFTPPAVVAVYQMPPARPAEMARAA
ncbi:MAG: hypothetical protein ABL908_02825 [Hyphomicrobium sp.]